MPDRLSSGYLWDERMRSTSVTVTAPGLSADARFVMAYDAARTLSLIVVIRESSSLLNYAAHAGRLPSLERGIFISDGSRACT